MASRVLISTILFLFCFSNFAHSGWFGPSNFDECVLEKMKGQDKSLLRLVAKMCEKEFPSEKQLGSNYIDNIAYEWTTDRKTISIKIEKNIGDYVVTKIKAVFSPNNCDKNLRHEDEIKSLVKEDTADSGEIPMRVIEALVSSRPAPEIEKIIPISGGRVGSFQVEGEYLYRCARIQEIYGQHRKQ